MSAGRDRLKRSASRLLPALATTLFSMRSRRLSHRLVRSWGLTALDDRIVARFGLVVAGGPFAGLRLPAAARAEHLGPYLAGTYESELHPWLARLRGLEVRTVLDVGAKFGYYALGLARWFPAARSVAFDTDPWARRALRAGARLNGLANLEVRGFLPPRRLPGFLSGPTLLVSDCEGFEARLLGEASPRELASTWMLVELHEAAAPGVERLLVERFAASHEAEIARRLEREAPPALVELLGAEDARRAVTEARGEQGWLFLRPRGTAAADVRRMTRDTTV